MSGFLDRSRIMKLFGELSEELERNGLRGHVYIIGGAALIAGYGRKRSTNDVDGKIVYEKRGVTEAARRLAERHDLPRNWLNENATLFMPHNDDSHATTVFNSPNLIVTGASAKHLLAMKIDAGRPEDVEDIAWLVEKLQIENIDQAIEVHRETYPHSALLTTSRSRRRSPTRPGRRARLPRPPRGASGTARVVPAPNGPECSPRIVPVSCVAALRWSAHLPQRPSPAPSGRALSRRCRSARRRRPRAAGPGTRVRCRTARSSGCRSAGTASERGARETARRG